MRRGGGGRSGKRNIHASARKVVNARVRRHLADRQAPGDAAWVSVNGTTCPEMTRPAERAAAGLSGSNRESRRRRSSASYRADDEKRLFSFGDRLGQRRVG